MTPSEHREPIDVDLVVIGGGIAGLAAAWEATGRGASACVLEADATVGGRLRTSTCGGVTVDEGADAFLMRVPHAIDLCREIGLDDLVHPAAGNAELFVRGERVAFPLGTVLGVPLADTALESVLSADARAAVRREPERTGPPLDGPVSIGEYMRGHFGDEVTDLLVEPLVGGINAGVVDRLDLDAVVPQLATAARSSASLVTALRGAPPPSPGPVFAAPAEGMAVLPATLATKLTERGVALRTDCPVDSVKLIDGRVSVVAGGKVIAVGNGAVLACPAAAAHAILDRSSAPRTVAALDELSATGVVVVTLVFDRSSIDEEYAAAGLLVPRTNRDHHITAVSFGSTKWAMRVPADKVVLRVSLGHADDHVPLEWDDAELLTVVRRELEQLLGLTAAPIDTRISRWPGGFAQYTVGHLDRIRNLRTTLHEELAAVAVAGSAYDGIGIPASIASGRTQATELLTAKG